jgi:hypothetical protein
MRKLFNIDQDEKNRILEMHENATKRHYLNEYSGVAFGGEQNGLKIEKVETTEQSLGTVAQSTDVVEKPKVDPAVLSTIQTTFPTPSKDTTTGVLSFVRGENPGKYDTIVKYLANSNYGRSIGVMDISNVTDMGVITKATKSNDMAIKALYDGMVSIVKNGYSNSLKDLTNYGSQGENIRIISVNYLDKLGIKYS